jgi:hypothetical protein
MYFLINTKILPDSGGSGRRASPQAEGGKRETIENIGEAGPPLLRREGVEVTPHRAFTPAS